jgi:prepilin-type N-terminal cleavage/methylation domain-containing protein
MKEKGITLIETIVALAVFGIVISIAINAFISGLEVQRKSLALQEAQNELRGALESMSREIRMSHIDWPVSSDRQPLIVLTTYPDNESVNYSLGSTGEAIGVILRNSVPFTSAAIDVEDLYFQVTDTNDPPALVTIIINAETRGAYAGQEINLETTISTRDYYAD